MATSIFDANIMAFTIVFVKGLWLSVQNYVEGQFGIIFLWDLTACFCSVNFPHSVI